MDRPQPGRWSVEGGEVEWREDGGRGQTIAMTLVSGGDGVEGDGGNK